MSGGNQSEEPFIVIFLMFVVVIFLGAFIWYVAHKPILETLRYVRLAEYYAVAPISNKQMDSCRIWLKNARVEETAPSETVFNETPKCFGQATLAAATNQIDYYGLTGPSITAIEEIVAPYFRWVWGGLFAFLCFQIVFLSKRMKFKMKLDLESFIRTQAKMWPVISPIVNFNPIKKSTRVPGSRIPEKLPLFAEALAPEEWVAWSRIAVNNDLPDREGMRRAFTKQLGPRWKNVDETSDYYKALFATFALKGVQKREESDELLGRIAVCWSENGGLNLPSDLLSYIKKINRDPEVGGAAADIADQHAFATTSLLGVLRWARWMGGVLAPGQFVWLRAVDRALWYPLNNLGRRSFHVEGAGAMAHFMAEQNAKKPLPIPRVDTAIITLNNYFNTVKPTVPLREGDKTKVRG